MIEKLIECVPNISEGRDLEKMDAIVAALDGVPGVWLLDRQMDEDHNRAVVTFAAEPAQVVEASARLAERASALIDLNQHSGVHPRIGALDVLPFIPLRGVTLEDCTDVARSAAREIWRRARVPSYLYEAAARRADRVNLANVRRGGFEGLRIQALREQRRHPDIGGPGLHPTAGAVAVGARKVMIAYNLQLSTADADIARRIARQVRFSSGGLPGVKAMGVMLRSRGQAQVSVNLTDFETTPPPVVFDAVRAEARALGCDVVGSELVGLIPRKALELAAGRDLKWENLTASSVLENRLAEVIDQGRDTIK